MKAIEYAFVAEVRGEGSEEPETLRVAGVALAEGENDAFSAVATCALAELADRSEWGYLDSEDLPVVLTITRMETRGEIDVPPERESEVPFVPFGSSGILAES